MIGIPELTANEEGYCCLQFDKKKLIHLQYTPSEESLTLFSELGFVDLDNQLAIYQLLLEGNFFNAENKGAVFSIQPETQIIFVSLMIPSEFLETIFEKKLEDFINLIDFWSVKLEELNRRFNQKESFEEAPKIESYA